MTGAALPERGPGPDRSGAAVWLLAVGQTLGYATLYYIFPAVLLAWEADLGWTKATLALGPTLAILVAAVLAPVAGRLVDRGWARSLLTGGPALGAAALLALTLVQTPGQFIAVWGVIGVAQAASLYEVCFSFLTRRFGADARPAITRVTLVAGFASTLAFPAGAWMAEAWGWRGAVLGFALAQLLVCVPINALAGRWLGEEREAPVPAAGPETQGLQVALGRFQFWLLAGIFGLLSLNHSILLTYFLPILAEQGATPGIAVLAASCVGPAQVAGRVILMLNEARLGTAGTVRFCILAIVTGSAVLALAGLAPVLIFGFALLQGGAMGMMSILRPVLTAEVLGRRDFGAISGAVLMASLIGGAAAPYLGAVLLAQTGVTGLLATTFLMAGAAFAGSLSVRTRRDSNG